MPLHNILTCSGWEGSTGGFVASAPCMKSRIGVVILFFILAIIRKWGGEEAGMPFSLLFSLIGGLGSYVVLVFLFGSFKLAFLIGLLGGVGGGFLGGMFLGGEE